MKQTFFINTGKRYHLMFILFLVLSTLVGCTSKEEAYLNQPYIDFEEYLKEDDELVLVNGEQNLIKELKEEYGVLYHMIVEYTDQEIEDIYNSMIYLAYKGYQYTNTNADKIYTNELPRVSADGFFYFHYEESDTISVFFKFILERNMRIYYSTNPLISRYKKYLEKIGDAVTVNTLFDNQVVNTKEAAIKLLSKKVDEKRKQVIFSLTYYEIYFQVEQETGIKFQRVRDSDLNPQP